MIEELKIIAATLVVVGIAVSFYDLKYSPSALLVESSPNRPAWLPWLGWSLTSASAILYIGLDFFGSWASALTP